MADINQDDIDKMLQGALGGDAAPEPPAPLEESGVASQDDIDALFNFVGKDDDSPADQPETPPAEAGDAPAEAEDAPAAAGAGEGEEDLSGISSNDDIDALFAKVGAAVAEPPPGEPVDAGSAEAGAAGGDEAELDELLSSITAISDAQETPEGAEPAEAAPPDDAAAASDGLADAAAEAENAAGASPTADELDLDELLKEVNAAAPPPLPKPVHAEPAGDPPVEPLPAPPPARAEAAPPPPEPVQPRASAPPLAAPPGPPPPAGPRREYSIIQGAGEVESVAGQISALISSMSEKANGYMQAWIASDSEARELRARALAEEHRSAGLASEKDALQREMETLRRKLGDLEGAKIAGEEASRTLETSFQARSREFESQLSLLRSEADALKDELSRVRNQATGIDIESRRARFEADRLKNEVESERMERLRMQRALDNREKELQTLQAQSSGQASSLFIDELHRLVRRLETELEAKTSSAHEALKQLDRLEAPESMVPVVANLRAAILRALGADDDPDDAIKSLGREAAGVRGPAALAPGKSEVLSFETALSTYNLDAALEAAGTLLREARATPGLLMRKIYQCPALRRPEVAEKLADLTRLLDGLRTIQEAGDRSRGSESGESEVFYVQMFDFLHNLVRLKIVTRLAGDIWRIFLDLRGRFSFVTSDRQWAEYRDGTLGGKDAKA